MALAALVVPAVLKLWPNVLSPTNLPAFKAAVTQEVRDHAAASGALAQRQYRRQRTAAGETSTFRVALATLPSEAEIGELVDAALREAGVDLGKNSSAAPDTGALADAKERLAKAAEDTVFDTGVRTILGNAGRDRAARGYARIPEPEACAFCLMLATRGAVYKAERAGRRGKTGDSFAASNTKFTDHPDALPSSIKVHDNCRCHPEPVFGVYEAPARVREAEDTYIAASKAGGGRKAVAIRFRQMVEGRYTPDE
jgi:hypothetical protein